MPNDEVVALLPKGFDYNLVTTQVDADDVVYAPVSSGQKLGTVSVYYDEELISTTDLVSTVDIKRDNLNYILHKFFEFLKNNIVVIIIICVVVITLWIIVAVANKRHRERVNRRRNHRYR